MGLKHVLLLDQIYHLKSILDMDESTPAISVKAELGEYISYTHSKIRIYCIFIGGDSMELLDEAN